MLNNNNSDIAFNNFQVVPMFPYKIIEKLATKGTEDIWKIIKYQDIKPLDKTDLTYEQKMGMIWSGQTDEENYNIFLKSLVGNSLPDSTSQMQLRIYRNSTIPNTRMESVLNYEIDIICNDKTANIFYDNILCERTDVLENLLIDNLNGLDIGGTGYLQFNRELSRQSQSMLSLGNSKTLYGRAVVFSLLHSNPSVGNGGCL